MVCLPVAAGRTRGDGHGVPRTASSHAVDRPGDFVSCRAPGTLRMTPSHEHRALQRPRGRAALAEDLGRAQGIFATAQRRPAPEILRARDVPLSVGAHPYGARAQLHDGRRGRALQARDGASTCCIRWAGTPSACRRKTPRWRRKVHPEGLDLRQHRGDEGAAAVDGAVARLGARDRDLRSGLLQAPAEDVPRLSRSAAWSSARSRR